MARFSTKFENPVKVKGYPLTLGIVIDASAPAPLYFQCRYLDINRAPLETRSTLIPQSEYGKYLRLNIGDDMLPCAVFIETDITDTNVNTFGVCLDGSMPAPPVNGIVDDDNDTFDFTLAQNEDMASYLLTDHEYRYRPVGGEFTAWATVTVKPIPVGNIDIATGDVQVRLKASGIRLAGGILPSAAPFTFTAPPPPPGAPAGGEADSLSNMAYFTPDPGTTVDDYEQEPIS